MRVWLLLVVGPLLLAGCTADDAAPPPAEPMPEPTPEVVVAHKIAEIVPLSVGDDTVIEVTGPGLFAVRLQSDAPFKVGPTDWSVQQPGPEMWLMLNTEPGAMEPGNTTACGAFPANVLNWVSVYDRLNVDRVWPEIDAGAHTLYVWLGGGSHRIGFNGADLEGAEAANVTMIDATNAYHTTLVDVPVVVTAPSPLEATVDRAENLTGHSLVLARFHVEMQGTGVDQRSEGHLTQGETECASASFGDPDRPALAVLGVNVYAYTLPGEVVWSALARTDVGTDAEVRISRLVMVTAAPEVARPFWF